MEECEEVETEVGTVWGRKGKNDYGRKLWWVQTSVDT